MVKLHQMAVLVSQASDITERELRFIGAYPLGLLLETEAGVYWRRQNKSWIIW
jgi:hypothetical protein